MSAAILRASSRGLILSAGLFQSSLRRSRDFSLPVKMGTLLS
jgi:hypothetical protein